MTSASKIPSKFQVGGCEIEVKRVERCDDDTIGCCILAQDCIEIANKFGKDFEQGEQSKINTFYHELTHAILRTMGETELNENEKFVCSFSSFLTEAMKNAFFVEKED